MDLRHPQATKRGLVELFWYFIAPFSEGAKVHLLLCGGKYPSSCAKTGHSSVKGWSYLGALVDAGTSYTAAGNARVTRLKRALFDDSVLFSDE